MSGKGNLSQEDKEDKGRRDTGRFIGERIEVVVSDEGPRPLSFTWRGREYRIREVIRSWHDHGFSPAGPRARKHHWLLRHHRNVYVVKTDSGDEFEIYMDRSGGRRDWYLYRQIK